MKKRIHLKKRKKISIFWIIIILVTFIFIIGMASNKIKKTSQSYANNEIKKTISKVITESIKENLNEENIFNIEKNNEDITSIDIDTKKTNTILVNINNTIQKKIDSIENTIIFKMPLFAPTNNIFIANIGPKIPIKFKTIGNVLSNIRTEVKNYGINNALITAYIDIKIECQVILPLNQENIEINQNNVVAMKVIQGKIPNYYIPTN